MTRRRVAQSRGWQWGVLFVCQGLVVLSAIGVIQSKQQCRTLFAELQRLDGERDHLDNEWSKLLLEQSAWSSDGRIDQIARDDLHMKIPDPKATIMVAS